MRATRATIWAMRGLLRFFWKYELTRRLRSRALPTYSTSPCSSICRYTPGRFGSSDRKDFRLKSAGILIVLVRLQGIPVQGGGRWHQLADAVYGFRRRRELQALQQFIGDVGTVAHHHHVAAG